MAWRKRVKIVEVVWDDTMGMGGWQFPSAVKEFVEDPTREHRSVGYLEVRNKRGIWIAQSEGRAGTRGEVLHIPRSAIRRVTTVMQAKEGR